MANEFPNYHIQPVKLDEYTSPERICSPANCFQIFKPTVRMSDPTHLDFALQLAVALIFQFKG